VSDLDVTLPHAKTRSIASDARINLTVGMDGELAFDDKNIRVSQLSGMIAGRIEKDGDDLMVVVRADEGVSYHIVEDIMRIARESGAKRLGIATQQSDKVEK